MKEKSRGQRLHAKGGHATGSVQGWAREESRPETQQN